RATLPAPAAPCTRRRPGGEAAARQGCPRARLAATRARAAYAAGCRSRWWRGGAAPSGRAGGDAEVRGVGVMEDDRGDARFGIHHAAVRQFDADFLRAQHAEEDLLVLQAGAGGITERVPLPVIVRLEPIDHARVQRVREPPLAAQLRVEQPG